MAVTYKFDKTNFSYIYQYDSTTGLFSENLWSLTAFDYFNNNAVVGDILYLAPSGGNDVPMDSLLFYIGTAIAGTGITITPEYWNGTVWTTLIDYEDETQGFTQTGEKRFYFDITKQTGIYSVDVNGYTKPWIRFRISALTTITEGGAQSTQRVKKGMDKILIDSYTSTTPATFADIYLADKAGSFDLKVRTGVSAIDGAVINNTYNLRPTDDIILGGGKNNLYINVTNFTGLTDMTIQLSGTDMIDNAQTEDIVITANGTYYTTKYFKTLTGTQITVVNGTGSLDYTITQGSWGISWAKDTWCQFDRPIGFRDTYMEDSGKQITLDESIYHQAPGTAIFTREDIASLSYVTFGGLVDGVKKTTENGISFFVINTSLNYASFFPSQMGHIMLYSCTFNSLVKRDTTSSLSTNTTSASSSRVWNCDFRNNFQCGLYGGVPNNIDIYNISANNNSVLIRRADGTTTVEKLTGNGLSIVCWFQSYPGFVKDLWARNSSYAVRVENLGTNDCYAVNFDVNNWTIDWASTNSGNLYRQNSLKLKITADGGTGVEGVKVLFSKTGETSFEVLTNASGDIVDSTFIRIDGVTTSIATNKLIDSSATFITNGIRKGQYVFNKDTTKFSYVVSVDSETQITLRDDIFTTVGDMYFVDECILTYGTYDSINGSVIQNSSAWNIKIMKAGYKTHNNTLVVDSKRDLTVKLERPVLNMSKSIRLE